MATFNSIKRLAILYRIAWRRCWYYTIGTLGKYSRGTGGAMSAIAASIFLRSFALNCAFRLKYASARASVRGLSLAFMHWWKFRPHHGNGRLSPPILHIEQNLQPSIRVFAIHRNVPVWRTDDGCIRMCVCFPVNLFQWQQ